MIHSADIREWRNRSVVDPKGHKIGVLEAVYVDTSTDEPALVTVRTGLPTLVRLVREHIKEFGTADDGRLFRAARGGHLLSKEYGELWKAARLAVLAESETTSPLADVPYSLRHAGVSLWLESGVSPAEVARRAGHSIAVLFRFYAKAIHRNQQRANQQIERALDTADTE
jgi:integrase